MTEHPPPPFPRTVLVTGVGGRLGSRVAADLARRDGVRVLGIDPLTGGRRPAELAQNVEFCGSPVGAEDVVRVLAPEAVDTVVHTAVYSRPAEVGGRAVMKDRNVLDAMQLFGACVRTPAVTRLVVRSSSAVYGYGPRNPGRFTETMRPPHPPSRGFSKDSVEIEEYARAATRRRPDLSLTVLRYAPLIGPDIDTELTRYFRLRLAPTALGRDPRIQLLHADDAVRATCEAVFAAATGTFNIAGDGVLGGHQALRMAGRTPLALPGPLLAAAGSVLRAGGLQDFSAEELRWLLYGVVLDTARARRDLGFTARWSTRGAFADFLRSHGIGRRRTAAPVTDQAAGSGAGR